MPLRAVDALIALEVGRLTEGYTANFQEQVRRLGRLHSSFLHIKPRWPIEAVAMRLMTDTIRDAVREKIGTGLDQD